MAIRFFIVKLQIDGKIVVTWLIIYSWWVSQELPYKKQIQLRLECICKGNILLPLRLICIIF